MKQFMNNYKMYIIVQYIYNNINNILYLYIYIIQVRS